MDAINKCDNGKNNDAKNKKTILECGNFVETYFYETKLSEIKRILRQLETRRKAVR